MNFRFVLLISFFLISCSNTESIEIKKTQNFDKSIFDTVSKELIIQENIPKNILTLSNQWFNKNVKVDGFDGSLTIVLKNYQEKTSIIENGKKFDVSLNFEINIDKPILSSKKFIQGEVKSNAFLEGNFSISDFDELKKNVQYDLILRLSRFVSSAA